MKRIPLNIILIGGLITICVCFTSKPDSPNWGFFAHQKINKHAIFSLPPQMIVFYKKHVAFIEKHAVDADKRRYIVPNEGYNHFIDIDYYGESPYENLPRQYDSAIQKFSLDTVTEKGILPWKIQLVFYQLQKAFENKNTFQILKYSADLGHYVADANVPLHTSSNHNGQLTNQHGIHAFWESRVPELLCDAEWNLWIGKADYIDRIDTTIWHIILSSAAAVDSVLLIEKKLSQTISDDQRFAFEQKNGKMQRQYAAAYTKLYHTQLNNMVEKQLQKSIYYIASFWYTAWVRAGQPNLQELIKQPFDKNETAALDSLQVLWLKNQHNSMFYKSCD